MVYNPKTNWKENETVMPADLNRIETGVKDAHERVAAEVIVCQERDTELQEQLTMVNTQLSVVLSPYAPARIYALDELVMSGGAIYKSLQDSNAGHAVTDPAWWIQYGGSVNPEPDPEQVINYQMLYYCGDECGDATGGWDGINDYNTGVTTKGNSFIKLATSAVANSFCFIGTKNKIKFSTADYKQVGMVYDHTITSGTNNWIFIAASETQGRNPAKNQCDRSNVSGAKILTSDVSDRTSDNYILVRNAAGDSSGTGSVTDIVRAVYLLKPDNYTAVLRAANITKTYPNAADLVADTTAMTAILSRPDAVKVLVKTCTGDLMAAILQSPEWITAIKANDEAYRIIMANPHWAKFIAVIPTAAPLLNYTMLYDQGDECESVTGGWAKVTDAPGPVEKQIDRIKMTGIHSGANEGAIVTQGVVDFVKYKYLFAKINAISLRSNYIKINSGKLLLSNILKSFRIDSTGMKIYNFGAVGAGGYILCGCGDYLSQELHVMWAMSEDPYQPWLNAAGISKTYATLDAVLADTNTLAILMSNETAIEYMISCSGTLMAAVCQSQTAMTALCNNPVAYGAAMDNVWWYKFMTMSDVGLAAMDAAPQARSVPTMTSDTTPEGMAQITSQYDGSKAAYKAFDKSLNTTTASLINTGLGWRLSYVFSSPIMPYKFTLLLCDGSVGASGVIRAVEIQASNDGENWHTLSTVKDAKPFSSLTIINSFCAVSYQYFSVIFKELSGSGPGYNYYASVTEFNVYGKVAD